MEAFDCYICGATWMTFDQFQSHYASAHIYPSLFRCPSCHLRFETSDLLKEHMVDTGHSVAEDVRMVLVWSKMSTLITSADDICDMVETFQARKEHSEEADILAACGNRILTEVCGIEADLVEPTGTLPVAIDQTDVQSEPTEMEKFCGEMMKIDFDQDPIEWFLRAIDYLLGMICGQNELTLVAKRTSLKLLELILRYKPGVTTKDNLMGERPFVQNVCESIRIQLNNTEYEDTLAVSWECFSTISGGSNDTEKRFLDADGLNLFLQCYQVNLLGNPSLTQLFSFYLQKFGNHDKLVRPMMIWMVCVSDANENSFRQDVLTNGSFGIFWEIWVKTKFTRRSYLYAVFFCNFLADYSLNWPSGPFDLTPVEVEENLISLMLRLTKSYQFCAQMKTDGEFQEILEFLWKLWGDSEVVQIRHFCSRIFSICLSIGPTDWPLDSPTIEDVKLKLWKNRWRTAWTSAANKKIVEVTMSSLIERFDPKLPAELLPDVILLMRIELEDLPTLMFCHGLINVYTADQLKQLETHLRRSLVEELMSDLISVVIHHIDNSVVVVNFVDLIRKIDSNAMNILLEIICDENLTPTARKSASKLLMENRFCTVESIVVQDGEGLLLRQALVEKLCRSIRLQLGKCDYDEMLISWKILSVLCFLNVESRNKMLDSGEMGLFQECYEKCHTHQQLVRQMGLTMMSLVGFSDRQDLMTDVNAKILWEMWRDSNEDLVKRYCCHIFCASLTLSLSTGDWPFANPTRNEVELKFVSVVVEMLERPSMTNVSRPDFIKDNWKDLWQLWQFTKVPQISSVYCQIFDIFVSDCPADWPVENPTKEDVKDKLMVETVVKQLVEDVVSISL